MRNNTILPLPCFLELRILNDFGAKCPELRILKDFKRDYALDTG